jgi:hypothetical protein
MSDFRQLQFFIEIGIAGTPVEPAFRRRMVCQPVPDYTPAFIGNNRARQEEDRLNSYYEMPQMLLSALRGPQRCIRGQHTSLPSSQAFAHASLFLQRCAPAA